MKLIETFIDWITGERSAREAREYQLSLKEQKEGYDEIMSQRNE